MAPEYAGVIEVGQVEGVPDFVDKDTHAVKLLGLYDNRSVRDTVVLPNQFSAQKKVLVFAKGDKAEEARAAGAAYVGDSDLIDQIKGGWMDFDVAVATPDMMKEVGKLGPILGRIWIGLM